MAKPLKPVLVSGTKTAIVSVPVSLGGEDVNPNEPSGFSGVGELVPLSMHVEVVPEPHQPCKVAFAGEADSPNAKTPPIRAAIVSLFITVTPTVTSTSKRD